MQWIESGIVLSVKKHGETSAIVQLLTREHGRCAGLVRGAFGRSMRGVLQPGNEVHASWNARLDTHLGVFKFEMEKAWVAYFIHDPLRLAALSSACSMLETTLPEREAHAAAYDSFLLLLESFGGSDHWPHIYVRWELGLLGELGFGLDLSACAKTGAAEGLAYVSPRTGRAVTAAAAGKYKHRLLKLPQFLSPGSTEINTPLDGIVDGLALTGFFIERYVLAPHNMAIPPARIRFASRFIAKLRQ